jgi:hypothetical protein
VTTQILLGIAGLFLVLPSRISHFDGLPLDRPGEFIVATLLAASIWQAGRDAWRPLFDRRISRAVIAAAAAGVLISIAATLYPALLAARVRPAAGMRH